MYFRVDDIPTKYRHPEQAQFDECLRAVDFAPRYDALCAAHPKRGPEVPVGARMPALQGTGRRWYYNRQFKFYALRERERLPKYCGLGLDLRIDARVETALLFSTPDGHLSAPLAKLARNMHRFTEPGFVYRPAAHPAPRIGSLEELPAILTDCLALYDLLAEAIRAAGDWWRPALARAA
ncbi:MAG: hypothetical protein KIT84_33030 [Labilithrix sp.]|nr:hypothetical protein [Labilithrix sp.]MCW5815900.1 hypothetical protein [Labilithrix sp.]